MFDTGQLILIGVVFVFVVIIAIQVGLENQDDEKNEPNDDILDDL